MPVHRHIMAVAVHTSRVSMNTESICTRPCLTGWDTSAAAAALVFAGAQMEFDLVWDVADVLMGVMALINLPVIVLLGRTALSALKDYTSQRREGKDPVFRAASIGLKEKTDFWN